jgi:cellulose synthase operon protein C
MQGNIAKLPLATLIWVAALIAPAFAADDWQKFLEALRQRHYFDTAQEYLERRAADPTVSAEFKRNVPYEQALILIESAAGVRDPQVRDRQLDQAQAKLKEFIASEKDPRLSAQARDRLGNLLRYRAADLMARAGDQPKLRADAQTLYKEAITVFDDLAAQLRKQLDAMPAGEQKELREEIGGQWLGACLNAGRTTFDLAMCAPANSDARIAGLKSTAKQCGTLYQKYPKRLGAAYAHFYEGRASEELGERTKALTAYQDLMMDLTESDAAFRPLKTQAMRQALALWVADKNYATAVDKSLVWAKSAKGDELQDADWLSVKLSTAAALNGVAVTLPKKDPKAAAYFKDARELIGDVLKSKNTELQRPARELLAQIGTNTAGGTAGAQATSADAAPKKMVHLAGGNTVLANTSQAGDTARSADVKSFDAAFDKLKEAAEDLQGAQDALALAQQEEKPDAKLIADLKASIAEKPKQILPLCQQAIELADAKSNVDKLNETRYLLCYFNYTQGNYYEAAVIGQFMAKTQPKAAGAQRCAHLALASLDAIARKERQAGRDPSYESGKIAELAQYIIGQWADQPEAAVAVEVLLNSALNSGDYEKAMATLKRIPPDSKARADAEVRLGHALWSKYLRRAAELREQKTGDGTQSALDDPKNKKELESLVKQAQQALEHAAERLRKSEEVSDRGVLAMVALAQLYVKQSQNDKAIAILQDPKIGPLTLLDAKNPAVQAEGIPAEIYRIAVRAYIGAQPSQLDKAAKTLNSLEQLSASEGKASNFTQLLVGIAYDLVQQFDDLKSSGDKEKQAQLAKSIDTFLTRILQRAATADFNTLNWVAAAYEDLAGTVSPDDPTQTTKPSADAVTYYQQATKAYDEIFSRAKADAKFMPAGKETALKFRSALDSRNAGKYDSAIAAFAEILKQNPNQLPVQVEAARTYQMRGANEKPDWYGSAIKGGSGPADSVWGWGKISQMTRSSEKFRDTFHQARYNIAVCRKEWAETYKDADKRREELELAKDAIRSTRDFESTMGGDRWKPQYDKLLRSIQKELGQPVIGLIEFEPKTVEPTATETKK